MSGFLARLLYGMAWLLTLPPLPWLYLLEKPTAWMLRKVLRYRAQTIKDNLSLSFPEKSGADRDRLVRDYYRWLYRVFVESLKSMHWSVHTLQKRIHLRNPELLLEWSRNGQDIIVLTGHTGNWEWTPGAISPYGFQLLGVYKPQTSQTFNELTRLIREKKGVTPIPMRGTVRAMKQKQEQDAPRALLLIADQIPALGDIHFWHPFLNQETAWFTGGEKIALKEDLPVGYLKIFPMKKGHYGAELIPLRESGEKLPDQTVTRFYIHALEENIREYPAFWLWSHRRWKHRRENLSL